MSSMEIGLSLPRRFGLVREYLSKPSLTAKQTRELYYWLDLTEREHREVFVSSSWFPQLTYLDMPETPMGQTHTDALGKAIERARIARAETL